MQKEQYYIFKAFQNHLEPHIHTFEEMEEAGCYGPHHGDPRVLDKGKQDLIRTEMIISHIDSYYGWFFTAMKNLRSKGIDIYMLENKSVIVDELQKQFNVSKYANDSREFAPKYVLSKLDPTDLFSCNINIKSNPDAISSKSKLEYINSFVWFYEIMMCIEGSREIDLFKEQVVRPKLDYFISQKKDILRQIRYIEQYKAERDGRAHPPLTAAYDACSTTVSTIPAGYKEIYNEHEILPDAPDGFVFMAIGNPFNTRLQWHLVQDKKDSSIATDLKPKA